MCSRQAEVTQPNIQTQPKSQSNFSCPTIDNNNQNTARHWCQHLCVCEGVICAAPAVDNFTKCCFTGWVAPPSSYKWSWNFHHIYCAIQCHWFESLTNRLTDGHTNERMCACVLLYWCWLWRWKAKWTHCYRLQPPHHSDTNAHTRPQLQSDNTHFMKWNFSKTKQQKSNAWPQHLKCAEKLKRNQLASLLGWWLLIVKLFRMSVSL